MTDPILPKAQSPVNSGGPFTREWYDLLRSLYASMVLNADDAAAIAAILVRLEALENETETFATINGLNSVQVTGSLESGLVQIEFINDSLAPGNTYYYGTGPTGVKGWSTLASAFTASQDGIELVTGADGVTDIRPDDDLEALEALSTFGLVARTALNTWTTRTATGTANRITVAFGDGVSGNPTFDIAATYVGQTSITTLGTITTGTWNGTAIGPTFGGTGQSSYALGDVLYSSATNVLSKLPGNITTTKQYLSQTGAGAVSAAPAWSAIAGSDITGAALTKTDDTNVTLTLGGTPTTALLRATSLTLGWTGTLAATRGGTGIGSYTAGNYLNAATTTTLQQRTPAQVLSDIAAQPLDATLTALAGANWAANSLPIGSGADTVAQVAFAANTFPARASTGNLVAKAVTDGSLGVLAGTSGTAVVLRGDGTASNNVTSSWSIGTASNPLTFTPTLSVEFDDTIAIPSSVLIRYGNSTSSGFFAGYKARGTAAVPTQALSGDTLVSVRASGWHSGGAFGNNQGDISITATENFTSTAQGTRVNFRTTAAGTTSLATRWYVDEDGGLKPQLNDTYDIGTTALHPANTYSTNLVAQGGRLWGTALHNNASGASGTTNQYVASGTYTPTLFNTTNIAASTAFISQWIRVGNVVTVSGKVTIDPTAAATLTVLGMSLPIASALTTAEQLGGTMASADVAALSGACAADFTNDRAFLFYTNAADIAARNWYYSFTYLVV